MPYLTSDLWPLTPPKWTPRLGRIRRRTHPSHMGHPSGSDGLKPTADRGPAERMPRLGRPQAEKGAQAMKGHSVGSCVGFCSRSWDGVPLPPLSTADRRFKFLGSPISLGRRPDRFSRCDTSCHRMSRLGRPQAEKGAQAMKGHSVGSLISHFEHSIQLPPPGLFDRPLVGSPATWVGQAENPPKPRGTFFGPQSTISYYQSPAGKVLSRTGDQIGHASASQRRDTIEDPISSPSRRLAYRAR